jgi:acetyl-CoA acetyltransferase
VKLENVAVLGVGQVRFGVHKTKTGIELARDAGLLALADAGIDLGRVNEAFVGYLEPAAMLAVKAMKELGLTGLPVTHVENASATGLVAFREAAHAVASGRARVALALGFDKMSVMARRAGGRGPPRHVDR